MKPVPPKRVALVASYAPSLLNFRGALIRDILARGHDVLCIAPDFDEATRVKLKSMGAEVYEFELNRTGLNPSTDLNSLKALISLFKNIRPDVVMGYTPKPVIYATLAAWKAEVPHIIPMITGLGFAFLEGRGIKHWLVRQVMKLLYRLALQKAHGVIFHNDDDHRHLASFGVIPRTLPVHIVNGSGVDLTHFTVEPLPPFSDGLTFALIARLVRYKGVQEYCVAAKTLKSKCPGARWLLIGPEEKGPAGLPLSELKTYGDAVEYVGPSQDVRPYLAQCHVYVLPSYGEGMPRTVLEAMATGRAIITTDTRGCRQTVEEGVNGYKVPVRDAEALADTMEDLLKRPDRIVQMARQSRLRAEKDFDVRVINQDMIRALGL